MDQNINLDNRIKELEESLNNNNERNKIIYSKLYDFLYSNSISNSEAYMVFESYVLDLLKQYIQKQDKQLIVNTQESNGFDAILPQGVDEINTPTYVEVKFVKHYTDSFINSILSKIKESENQKIKSILFIVPQQMPDTLLSNITNISKSSKISIIFWDVKSLIEKAQTNLNNINTYFNPVKKVIETNIFQELSEEKRQRNNSGYILEIKEKYRNEDLVLFLGAGVSVDAGIPLWNDLIYKLFIEMIHKLKTEYELSNSIDTADLVNIAYNNKEDSPLAQTRYIRGAFQEDEYIRILHRILYENNPRLNTPLLDSIVKLCTPRRTYMGAKAIVTYNFDDLIERCLQSKDIDINTVYRDTDISQNHKLNIYHVHGYLPKNYDDSLDYKLIFSEEDYHKVFSDSFNWSNILQLGYLRDSTCLFVGSSMTDPNIRRLLDIVSKSSESPRHYAILKRKSVFTKKDKVDANHKNSTLKYYQDIDARIRELYYRSLGLNILWVNEYSEIPRLLNEITVR